MSVAVVTTFNAAGYEQYGKRMIESYLDYWPTAIPLYVYTEGFRYPGDAVHQLDLHEVNPELVAFKKRNKDRYVKNFRYDAIRFAHKVFAVTHAAATLNVERLFWLDGDTVTFRAIPMRKMVEWLPEHYYTSCLLRRRKFTECSFVGYRVTHPYHSTFMRMWRDYYISDSIYSLKEYHDCEAYDTVRKQLELSRRITTYNLSGRFSGCGHPFVNCDLGGYMDHAKGRRKDKGHSDPIDLRVKRTEDYWRKHV